MPLPRILRISDPLPLDELEAGVLAVGAASSGVQLVIEVPQQEKENWCWAAVSVGVIAHYEHRNVEQCEVAGAVLKTNCCSGGCNVPHFMNLVLDELHHFGRSANQLEFSQIRAEIGNHPVACWIDHDRRVGHFVLITGWIIDENNRSYVFVVDPSPGAPHVNPGAMPFSRFQASYDSGSWRRSYTTV